MEPEVVFDQNQIVGSTKQETDTNVTTTGVPGVPDSTKSTDSNKTIG